MQSPCCRKKFRYANTVLTLLNGNHAWAMHPPKLNPKRQYGLLKKKKNLNNYFVLLYGYMLQNVMPKLHVYSA